MDACEHKLEGTMELAYRTRCVKCNKLVEAIQAERIADLEREIADGLTPKERLLRAEIEQMPRQTRDQYLVDYLARLNPILKAIAPPHHLPDCVTTALLIAMVNAEQGEHRSAPVTVTGETNMAVDPTMLTQFEALCQASDPSQAIDGESITATKLCDSGRRIKELELALALIAEQTEYMVCDEAQDNRHLQSCSRCVIRATIAAVTPQTQGE